MTHELQNQHGSSVTRHGSFVTPSLIQAPFLWITFPITLKTECWIWKSPRIAGFDKVSSYFWWSGIPTADVVIAGYEGYRGNLGGLHLSACLSYGSSPIGNVFVV